MPAQHLKLAVGYGLGWAYERKGDADLTARGFYSAGEYYVVLNDWVSPRAYGGMIFSGSQNDATCVRREIACDVSAKLGFMGLKARIAVPIPYVSPFLEVGIGVSIGALNTRTLRLDEDMAGFAYHIPVQVGFAIGERHEYELAFAYLFHPHEKQAVGGIALGIAMVLTQAMTTTQTDSLRAF